MEQTNRIQRKTKMFATSELNFFTFEYRGSTLDYKLWFVVCSILDTLKESSNIRTFFSSFLIDNAFVDRFNTWIEL